MIDHIHLFVANLEEGKRFYAAALASLGYGVLREGDGYCGIGPMEGPEKWIGTIWLSEGRDIQPLHIAFRVKERSVVDRFYKDALKAGGTDNGAPGIRAEYHDAYYAAFVLDPSGHNVEVVCHELREEEDERVG